MSKQDCSLAVSVATGYGANTEPSQFYSGLVSAMALALTVFGVPFVFLGLLKRVDVPAHSRTGIPTERRARFKKIDPQESHTVPISTGCSHFVQV